jgi:hypothetical protein
MLLSLKRLPIAVAGQHKNDIELQKKIKSIFYTYNYSNRTEKYKERHKK